MDVMISRNLPNWPRPKARSILAESVSCELAAYRKRQNPQDAPLWLSLSALQEALESGALRFGSRDLPVAAVDDEFALRAAEEAVRDGIVLMFVDELRISDLDQALDLSPDSMVRYIKLTALRGF